MMGRAGQRQRRQSDVTPRPSGHADRVSAEWTAVPTSDQYGSLHRTRGERRMAEERAKALEAALGQIEKQFGKGSVRRMADNLSMNNESIPTGALSLDLALGIGGLSR